MRLSLTLLAALTTLAAGNPRPCPYAEFPSAAPRDCPYSKLARDASPKALSKRAPSVGTKGVMYMNRIGPSGGQLYIANADGSNAIALMGNQTNAFDYHANWSPDGEWIVFTSERRGNGQSDVYRVKTDGTGLETLVSTDAFEDSGALSPDGTQLAYVSTAINHTSNVFVLDLATNTSVNITGSDETVGNFASPHSFLRPVWSPDGQYIALSSDANTGWTGHNNGTGWEHTQTLAIYIVRPNGSDFQKVIGQEGYSLGSPKWSGDSTRISYYNMTLENTYAAHGVVTQETSVVSQIYSVDIATGLDVVQETSGTGQSVTGSFIGNTTNIGYVIKAGAGLGSINYTSPDSTHASFSVGARNPSWSPDGSKVVYEILGWEQPPAELELFSFDSDWDYRYMDVFPQFNNITGRLVTTQKVEGNASGNVLITNADYTNPLTALDVYNVNDSATYVLNYEEGGAGAFQPTWKPDGSEVTVGFGTWFAGRTENPGWLITVNATSNSSEYDYLTNGTYNAGFPSYSPDGTKIVYRLWDYTTGAPLGLRIMDLATGNVTALTWGWDNTPGWSPDGELIVFTRQTNWTESYGPRWYADRYDVATIKPDGTELTILTESDANDAHAVWSADGRILYNSGMYGFRDECALYDNTFQPYGQIVVMNANGSNKTLLTDTMWEDSMPQYIPASYFE